MPRCSRGAGVAVVVTSRREAVKYWVGFHRVPFVGPMRIERLIKHFGDLERAWHASASELRIVLDERSMESLLKTRTALSLDDEMAKIERSGVTVLTQADEEYPPLLAQISAPPPVIYVKGEVLPEDGL